MHRQHSEILLGPLILQSKRDYNVIYQNDRHPFVDQHRECDQVYRTKEHYEQILLDWWPLYTDGLVLDAMQVKRTSNHQLHPNSVGPILIVDGAALYTDHSCYRQPIELTLGV